MDRISLPYLVFVLVLVGGIAFVNFERRRAHESEAVVTDTAKTATEVSAAFDIHHPNRVPSDTTNNTGSPWGDFVGSDACARCHQEEFAKWRKSFHSKTLYDADEHSIFGDFTKPYDEEFNERRSEHEDEGRKKGRRAFVIEPSMRIDESTGEKRYFMKVTWRSPDDGGLQPHNRGKADTYGNLGGLPDLIDEPLEVIYAFGNRMHQPYVVRYPNGQHWVLPVYWNDVEKQWLFAGFRSYVDSCANCHVTGIKTTDTGSRPIGPRNQSLPARHSLPPKDEGWADGAVGCENCHGPGRKHVREVERLGSKAYAEQLAAGLKSPTIWDGVRGEFRHTQDACGRCHNFHTETSCTWKPTPYGYTRDPSFSSLSNRTGKFQHYDDGTSKSPCTLVADYRTSKMSQAEVSCSECHDPHGTDNWADLTESIHDNALCIKCHVEYESIEAQTAHSHHAADSFGNRCVECHMPRHKAFTNGEQIMSKQIYSHTFSVPTGRRRVGGPPSSCNVCHTDRDHAWTRKTLKEWYGPGVDTTTILPIPRKKPAHER